MEDSEADPAREFRACVLRAYRSLLEHHGFAELPRRDTPHANPFSVRIGNSTTVIEVEGIHHGAAAWTKIFRVNVADVDYYGLPIGELLATRVPDRRTKRRRPAGQHADVLRDADDIMRYAQDVLSGDFSALDAIVSERRRLEEERLARAPSPSQRAANVACAEAGHAFKRGDYANVVKLLKPHLEHLSLSQRKRYEIACAKTADA